MAQASLQPESKEDAGPRGIVRETAHRLFAQEFNASRVEIKGQGEKDPSYVVSPLGAKINRLHVVGVCTDVEPVGQSGEVWRARVSDPSGIFTVYAGNYQPESAQVLSQLQVPAFVAITGKARTYEPEPGSVFVSIRPETITVVDDKSRDQWLLDTARRTMERLEASRKAAAGATVQELVASGIGQSLAEGAALAQEKYGLGDVERYAETVRTCLAPLVSGEVVPVLRADTKQESEAKPAPAPNAPAPAWKAPPAPAAADAAQDALDQDVLAAVQRLEGDKGARWEQVLTDCGKSGVTAEDVEEALNRLMDKGLVYEPTLGVLKTT